MRTSWRAVTLGLATVVAASVAISLSLGSGASADRTGAARTPTGSGTSSSAGHPAGRTSPATPTRATTPGEAVRLHALDPTQVARSVASDDAAAAGSTSAVKGVWKVGEVGTYLVGRGIAPGRYESAAPTRGTCRWARLHGLSGKAADVVESGSTVGRSVVTVRSSDAFFETDHCQNWHKVS